MGAAVLPAVLVDLTNKARLDSGQSTLVRNQVLDQAAQMKANDMASLGYFAHTSPAGITPWHWFSQVNYDFAYAGENLAVDFTESVDVENAWLGSPTHRANILNDNFTEIGIATAYGSYNGRPTTYVVQMFGKPISFNSNINISDYKNEDSLGSDQKINQPELKEENNQEKESLQVAVLPVVKGETTKTNIKEEELEVLQEDNVFISVKNNAVISEIDSEVELENTENEVNQKYSKWYERLIVKTPSYVNIIYQIFIFIILISLILMMVIEIKKQHPKNIIYGILLIIVIICFIYINKTIFLAGFIV